MNVHKLEKMFAPRTIAVIGASVTSGTVGFSLVNNLKNAGFTGKIFPVNPKYPEILELQCYPDISHVPENVDLAIIATPAKTVAEVVRQCATCNVQSLVVISAGFKEIGEAGVRLMEEIKTVVDQNNLALLGPNCLGFIRPSQKLNASFCRKMAKPGGIAFISQSGALGSAVLDWSVAENVGFSHFVSIGDMADIGYHDLIDYFGNDPATKSILIYMESLTNARKFLSAARGFARTKPIIILKVGKSAAGAKAALSHTGSITGNDRVFDAAFKRVGILRVATISELFDCAKTLAMEEQPKGNRLAIVTNAGGPGVIATDMLIDLHGETAKLSDASLKQLDSFLPTQWSHGNPVDVLGDADKERYRKAVEVCLNDPNTDGVLTILTPQAMTDAVGIARELVDMAGNSSKTFLTAWMGEDDVAQGRKILEDGQIPAFEKPEDAVKAFMNMYTYGRNLELLYETPMSLPQDFEPKTEANRQLIQSVVSLQRSVLTEPETKTLLANYGILVPRGVVVTSVSDIGASVEAIGFPLVAKIISPDIYHKTDVGGVIIGIKNIDEAKSAFNIIVDNTKAHVPEAKIDGVYFEEMVAKKYELLIGCKKDPIFGPAIVFGKGGTDVEIYQDTNVGLPPLNMTLAQRLMEDTKIYRLLQGYRGEKAVDLKAIQFLLYKFAFLVMDFSEIKELDINPYAVDATGGVVLDAKVVLDSTITGKTVNPYSHLMIRPYPKEDEKTVQMENGETVLLRAIRPEDEPMEAEFFQSLSAETKKFRFFASITNVTHEMLIRYTQIDYDREMVIVGEGNENAVKKIFGVARVIADPYNESAEFAIVVGDPWQKQGLGTKLMEHMLEIVKKRGIKKLYAFTLPDNELMLHLFEKYGFQITKEADLCKVELTLSA
jgi:acetyltransferase